MLMPHSSRQLKKGRDTKGDTVEWCQKPSVQQKTKKNRINYIYCICSSYFKLIIFILLFYACISYVYIVCRFVKYVFQSLWEPIKLHKQHEKQRNWCVLNYWYVHIYELLCSTPFITSVFHLCFDDAIIFKCHKEQFRTLLTGIIFVLSQLAIWYRPKGGDALQLGR